MCEVDKKKRKKPSLSSVLRLMDSAPTLLPWAWARKEFTSKPRSWLLLTAFCSAFGVAVAIFIVECFSGKWSLQGLALTGFFIVWFGFVLIRCVIGYSNYRREQDHEKQSQDNEHTDG